MNTNLSIPRGTSDSYTVNYAVNGVPTTLVGATVRFTVKNAQYDDTWDDSSAMIEKNITTGNSSGQATIALLPVDTAQVDPGTYYYDIKVELPDGTVYLLANGKFTINASPTNRYT